MPGPNNNNMSVFDPNVVSQPDDWAQPEEEWEDELDLSGNNNEKSSRYSGVIASSRGAGRGRQGRHHDEGDMVEYDIDTMNRVETDDEIISDDNYNSGASCLQWIRAVCIIFIVILVMIIPFFVVYRESNEYNNNNGGNNNNNNGGGGGGSNFDNKLDVKPLPDPPQQISTICSLQNLQTDAGYDQCSETCEVADCCEFPISLDLSCVFGNEMKCLNYHENCIRLNYPAQDPTSGPPSTSTSTTSTETTATTSNMRIPSAPLDIDILCEADRITSAAVDDNGYRICQMACSGAECCYDKEFDGPSCTQQDACAGYAPCLALTSLKKVHNQITEEVNRKCDMSNLLTAFGRDECLDTCAHALCCYAEDIVGPCPSKGNDDDNEDFCSQYEACANVFHVNKEQIDSLCDPNTGDEGTCMHLCFPARCCFDRGTCFDDINAPQDCAMYASCTRVFPNNDNDSDSSNTVDGIDVNIGDDFDINFDVDDEDDVDADYTPPTTTTGTTSTNTGSTTSTNGGSTTGSNTNSGSSTLLSSGETLRSPESVRQACSNHNDYQGPSNRTTLCDVECRPVACCFPSDTCTDYSIDCDQYSICSKVYVTNDQNSASALAIMQDLSNACDADVYDVDSTTCVQLCFDALCCFTLDPTKSCLAVGNNVNCGLYGACDIVYYHQ